MQGKRASKLTVSSPLTAILAFDRYRSELHVLLTGNIKSDYHKFVQARNTRSTRVYSHMYQHRLSQVIGEFWLEPWLKESVIYNSFSCTSNKDQRFRRRDEMERSSYLYVEQIWHSYICLGYCALQILYMKWSRDLWNDAAATERVAIWLSRNFL